MKTKGLVRVNVAPLIVAVAGAVPHRPDIQRVMLGIGAAAVQYWKRLAQSELKSTSRDYAAGIQARYDGNTAIIELTGQLPNMVENGWPGGDMREWMLKSPKAKQGKNGPYLVIPFRHGTPGSSGRNVGSPMPGAIHKLAKGLGATLSRPGKLQQHGAGGHTAWGERIRANMPMGKAARKILERKEKPWHATSIYMGMVRKEKTYEKTTQSSYTTFRTISRHSRDEQHWMHPGINPRRLAPRVQQHVEQIAGRLVQQAMGSSQ